MNLPAMSIELDPEWRVMRRYDCGHLVFACCTDHLDDTCMTCGAAYTPEQSEHPQT